MQPKVTRGAVAKPNSSAPIIAAIAMSLPVQIPPSTQIVTLSRSAFVKSAECASASPISQGQQACLMDDSGDAPVPPSPPEI